MRSVKYAHTPSRIGLRHTPTLLSLVELSVRPGAVLPLFNFFIFSPQAQNGPCAPEPQVGYLLTNLYAAQLSQKARRLKSHFFTHLNVHLL